MMPKKYTTPRVILEFEKDPEARFTAKALDGNMYLFLNRFHCIKCEKYTPKGKEYCGIPMEASWEKEE